MEGVNTNPSERNVASDERTVLSNEGARPIQLTSTAFQHNARIPKTYTADGPDASPPLQWSDPPDGTESFALICDDPDAPVGTWIHWVVYDIGADVRRLPENVRPQRQLQSGVKQGTNDFRRIGYGGPAPPRGPEHRYFFKLYALDIETRLKPGATKKELLNAMDGHVLAEAELVGLYSR